MPPPQNLALRHQALPSGGSELYITRETAPDAPTEPVSIRVDGQTQTWRTSAGPDETRISLPSSPGRVVLDPEQEVQQIRQDDDGWPPRWAPTFAAGLNEFNHEFE